MCTVEGCKRDVNRDGYCLLHKLRTVNVNGANLKAERNGGDVTSGRGTREYVRSMYEKRRAAGMEDPIPENKKAAAFAPRRKVTEGGYV